MKKNIFFDYQISENTRPYKQRNFIIITRVIIITAVLLLGFVAYSFAGESKTSSRAGLYSRNPVENVSSSAPSEATGLYSPLRANPTTTSGMPRPDDGIGTEVPAGDAPLVVLLTIIAIYLSTVFVRKQRFDELRTKELRAKN